MNIGCEKSTGVGGGGGGGGRGGGGGGGWVGVVGCSI